MASTRPDPSGTEQRPPRTGGDDAAHGGRPPRLKPLVPVIVLILALLMGFVVFNATRSGPNYQEEQFTPDPVQEGD